jgi:hypothetical protein
MKRIVTFVLALSFLATSFAAGTASIVVPKKSPAPNANQILIPIGKNGQKVSLMDLSQMRVKDYEALSGKKLKFMEKIEFSLGQKQLRNSIKADGTINAKQLSKLAAKPKEMNDKARHYLKLWLILLGAAIVVDIIAAVTVTPFIWIIGWLLGLGSVVFFVLWLIALAG